MGHPCVLLALYWILVLVGIAINVLWQEFGMSEHQYKLVDVILTAVMGVAAAAYLILTGKLQYCSKIPKFSGASLNLTIGIQSVYHKFDRLMSSVRSNVFI